MRRIPRLLVVAIALAAIVAGAGASYRPGLEIPSGLAGRHVEVDGLPLRVLQEGAGRDILFIHGSPGLLEDFDRQAAELAGSFRVTRYDRPGHGFSGDSGRYSIAHNAEVALALLEKLGLENVVVVGHSYGGSTALALAGLRSPRVAACVILDSAAYKGVRPVNPLYPYLRSSILGVGLARLLPSRTIEARISSALIDEFVAGAPSDEFVALRTRAWSAPKVMHAVANEHTGSNAELARQSVAYREIDVPVFIVAQEADAGRRENAERLQREVPGARLDLLANTGHYVQVEQPAAVTSIVRSAAERD